jgi:hypothetical protein
LIILEAALSFPPLLLLLLLLHPLLLLATGIEPLRDRRGGAEGREQVERVRELWRKAG